MQEARSVVVGFRIEKNLVEVIDQVARKQTRNRSQQILHWIRRGLREAGRLPEGGDAS